MTESTLIQSLLLNTKLLYSPNAEPTQVAKTSQSISQSLHALQPAALLQLISQLNSQNAPHTDQNTHLQLKILLWQHLASTCASSHPNEAPNENQIQAIMHQIQLDWRLHAQHASWFAKKISSLYARIALSLVSRRLHFLTTLLDTLLQSEDSSTVLFSLLCLQSITEIIFSSESRNLHWSHTDRLAIKQLYIQKAASIFQFIHQVLKHFPQNEEACCSAIETLCAFVHVIPDAALLDHSTLHLLAEFLSQRKYRNEILQLFTEWIGKEPPTQEQSHRISFTKQALDIFHSVFSLLAPTVHSIIQSSSFSTLNDRDQKFVSVVSSFIVTCFQSHMATFSSHFTTPQFSPFYNDFLKAHSFIFQITLWSQKHEDQLTRNCLHFLKAALQVDSSAFRETYIKQCGIQDIQSLIQIIPPHPSTSVTFNPDTKRLEKAYSSKQEFQSFAEAIQLLSSNSIQTVSEFVLKSLQETVQQLSANPDLEHLNRLQSLCNFIGTCSPLPTQCIENVLSVLYQLLQKYANTVDLKLWYVTCLLHVSRQSQYWNSASEDIFCDTIKVIHMTLQQKEFLLIHPLCCCSLLDLFTAVSTDGNEATVQSSEKKWQTVITMFESFENTMTSLSMEMKFEYYKVLGRALRILKSHQTQQQYLSNIMKMPHETLQSVLQLASQDAAQIVQPDNIKSIEYVLKAYAKLSSYTGSSLWAGQYQQLHASLDSLYNVNRAYIDTMWKQKGADILKIASIKRALRVKTLIIQVLENAVESTSETSVLPLLQRITADYLESPRELKPSRLLNLMSTLLHRPDLKKEWLLIFCQICQPTREIVEQDEGEYAALSLSSLSLLNRLLSRSDMLVMLQEKEDILSNICSILLACMEQHASKLYVKACRTFYHFLQITQTSEKIFSFFCTQHLKKALLVIVGVINDGDHKEAWRESIFILYLLLSFSSRLNQMEHAMSIVVSEFLGWNSVLQEQMVRKALSEGCRSEEALVEAVKQLVLQGNCWEASDFN